MARVRSQARVILVSLLLLPLGTAVAPAAASWTAEFRVPGHAFASVRLVGADATHAYAAVSGPSPTFAAHRLDTGAMAWLVAPDAPGHPRGLAIGADHVLVTTGTHDAGSALALRKADGGVAWRSDRPVPYAGGAVAADPARGAVALGASDADLATTSLARVEEATGGVAWTRDVPGALGALAWTPDGDLLVAVGGPGVLRLRGADGSILWTTAVSGLPAGDSDVRSMALSADGSLVYVGGAGGGECCWSGDATQRAWAAALDAGSGAQAWSRLVAPADVDGSATVAVLPHAGGVLAVAEVAPGVMDGVALGLYAPDSGDPAWSSVTYGAAPWAASLAPDGALDVVLAYGAAAPLVRVDAATGAALPACCEADAVLTQVLHAGGATLLGGARAGHAFLAAFGASAPLPVEPRVQESRSDPLPPPLDLPHSTLGWTAPADAHDAWRAPGEPPARVDVDVGALANKHALAHDGGGYRLRLGVEFARDVLVRPDGVADGGDEPCLPAGTPVGEVRVNGAPVATLRAGAERGCGAEGDRGFALETAGEVRVPVGLVVPGVNEVTVAPLDAPNVLPTPEAPGWRVRVSWAQMELVARPVLVLHGWDFAASRATTYDPEAPGCDGRPGGAAAWQCGFGATMRAQATLAFGQDPWAWAGEAEPFRAVGYNPKAEANASARVLAEADAALRGDLAWSGTVDAVAHSFGGLVAKAYAVSPDEGLALHRLVTMGTPHAGSRVADWYTCRGDDLFMNRDAAEYRLARPPGETGWATLQLLAGTRGADCVWRDYYAPSDALGAFVNDCEASLFCRDVSTRHAFDTLADFQLKATGPDPAQPNPFLAWLRARHAERAPDLASRLFAIAGVCAQDAQGQPTACPVPHVVDGATTDFTSSLLGTRGNDFVVDASSAIGGEDGNGAGLCVGTAYGHLDLPEAPAVRALALQALSDAWSDPTLLALATPCARLR